MAARPDGIIPLRSKPAFKEFQQGAAAPELCLPRTGPRRCGVRRALLDEALQVARSEGAGAVHLGVYPDNTAAVALYRAAGFTQIPRHFYSRHL